MSKNKKPPAYSRRTTHIGGVWAYNHILRRWQLDNKVYAKDGKWYFIGGDGEPVRSVDEREAEYMRKHAHLESELLVVELEDGQIMFM